MVTDRQIDVTKSSKVNRSLASAHHRGMQKNIMFISGVPVYIIIIILNTKEHKNLNDLL